MFLRFEFFFIVAQQHPFEFGQMDWPNSSALTCRFFFMIFNNLYDWATEPFRCWLLDTDLDISVTPSSPNDLVLFLITSKIADLLMTIFHRWPPWLFWISRPPHFQGLAINLNSLTHLTILHKKVPYRASARTHLAAQFLGYCRKYPTTFKIAKLTHLIVNP